MEGATRPFWAPERRVTHMKSRGGLCTPGPRVDSATPASHATPSACAAVPTPTIAQFKGQPLRWRERGWAARALRLGAYALRKGRNRAPQGTRDQDRPKGARYAGRARNPMRARHRAFPFRPGGPSGRVAGHGLRNRS